MKRASTLINKNIHKSALKEGKRAFHFEEEEARRDMGFLYRDHRNMLILWSKKSLLPPSPFWDRSTQMERSTKG